VNPDQGEILVTGAVGGVGSVAVSLLAKLGYTVVASSGRPEEKDYLLSLGATQVMDRSNTRASLVVEKPTGVMKVTDATFLQHRPAMTVSGQV
jgi:NADPH:quinone reductase-like Zn-dependent oxidoreductase